MKYKYYAPSYYKNFSCKMDKCNHTCCSGWRIPVSYGEYNKLITMECSDELNRRIQNTFVIPERVSEDCYRYISFNWLGNCPIQNNGICSLQREKGENYIPMVCKLYPRSLKSLNGINIACCSCSCERVIELLFKSDGLNVEKIEIDDKPQLIYDLDESDVKQIRQFNDILKNKDTTLTCRLEKICRIINNAEFEKDFGSDEDPVYAIIKLFKKLSGDNQRLEELSVYLDQRYKDDRGLYTKDAKDFEEKYRDWMILFENIINNSLIYECFPFVDKRADKTRVYKGLCFCYGLLKLICVGKHESEKELVDNISLLFHLIDHTPFYYNVSFLSENAAIMLKL